MPLRSSTKILIGAICVGAIGFLGFRVVPDYLIMRESFDPLVPGEVNILGVDTTKGYYIVVANQVAQLVLGSRGGFESPEKQESGGDQEKRRIPLRDMLGALQGDSAAMGKFVMTMNQINDSSLPAYPIVWNANDIQKAIDGDPVLTKKLEQDMNVRLDGSPTETLRFAAILEGIVIESPVTVKIVKQGKTSHVTGNLREEFRPRFMRDLEGQIAEEGKLTKEMMQTYYIVSAQKLLEDPSKCENIRSSLQSRISKSRMKQLAELPEQLLNSITVVVNDSFIEDGSYSTYEGSDGKSQHNMTIKLNEEGRRRLWQYSAKHRGEQLLVVWNGVAIAAPRMEQAIPFAEVQIKQISDQGLIEDTLDSIKRLNQNRKEKP